MNDDLINQIASFAMSDGCVLRLSDDTAASTAAGTLKLFGPDEQTEAVDFATSQANAWGHGCAVYRVGEDDTGEHLVVSERGHRWLAQWASVTNTPIRLADFAGPHFNHLVDLGHWVKSNGDTRPWTQAVAGPAGVVMPDLRRSNMNQPRAIRFG